MLLFVWHAVHNVVPLRELGEQRRNFLRRILEIIVNCDNDLVVCATDACKQGVVLPIIPHQTDPMNPGENRCQTAYYGPALITTGIIDQDDFVLRTGFKQGRV